MRAFSSGRRLSSERGGGSVTALPIAETDAGNLAAYIPTNLISITDGQIVLNSGLFAANQRPAVDVGLSVSRVGGKAQAPSLRQVSGSVRLAYAQFLELEMFTRFGGISDTRIKSQMDRGRRIRALLAQPRFSPLRLVDQVALLAALADGAFDGAPVECVAAVRALIAAHLDANAPDAVASLSGRNGLDDSVRGRLVAAVRSLIDTVRGSARGGGAP
jgi:F-type H+-transporting ATPase subunit alpha